MTFYKIAKFFICENIFLLKTQKFLIANISTYMVHVCSDRLGCYFCKRVLMYMNKTTCTCTSCTVFPCKMRTPHSFLEGIH